MGKTRTLSRIKERFMWHGMVNDAYEQVSYAEICMGTYMLYILNIHVRMYSVTITSFGYIRLQFLFMFQLTT